MPRPLINKSVWMLQDNLSFIFKVTEDWTLASHFLFVSILRGGQRNVEKSVYHHCESSQITILVFSQTANKMTQRVFFFICFYLFVLFCFFNYTKLPLKSILVMTLATFLNIKVLWIIWWWLSVGVCFAEKSCFWHQLVQVGWGMLTKLTDVTMLDWEGLE